MRGTFALLLYAVRADAIGGRANAFRVGSVLFILLLLGASHNATATAGSPGIVFFAYVSQLMANLITLAGLGHFASAITEEKEEGTLGLLLLADISPLSILLGKSTSRVFSALMVFAAQFPFALLALTVGGITVRQIFWVYVALSAYMFLLANVALLVSVICRRTGEALATMCVLSVLMHGAAPYLEYVVGALVSHGRLSANSLWVGVANRWMNFYRDTSVFWEIRRILDPAATAVPATQVCVCLAGGGMAFGAAWLLFRRVVWAVDLSAPPRPLSARRLFRRWTFIPRPHAIPLMWKDFHFLAGGSLGLIAKMVLFAVLYGMCWWWRDWIAAVTGLGLMQFILQCLAIVAGIELLVYASQLFHQEQKWGTLPTLMMLPHSAGYIGYTKLLGCVQASLPTWGLMIGVYLADAHAPKLSEWINRPGEVAVLCGFFVLCQLTVLCSLIVKWGALPMAAGLLLVLGGVAAPFLGTAMAIIGANYDQAYVQNGPILYATGLISVLLQLEIGRRIHLASAR